MPQHFDVCIRGAGVVGRTLALLLAKERLRVALVEEHAVPDAAAGLRAYALNAASRQLLESLRVWPAETLATPVSDIQVWNSAAPQPQLEFSAASIDQAALAWIVDVPALERLLADAARFQPQIEVVGSPVEASLQVVCEGSHSRSRSEFGVTWESHSYAQRAISARLESTQPHLGIARQWFSHGEVLALLPTGGAHASSLALVWSVSLERADALKKLSAEEFSAALQASCGTLHGKLSLTSERASWPLAFSSAQRWVGPGWALAGDAAHNIHPLAGQGLNLGLADVSGLASVLAAREYWRSAGDEKLLRRYERARKADVAAMGWLTDQLHGLFAHTDARWQSLTHWGLRGFARSGPLKSWAIRQATGRVAPGL
jgi:2-polyprenyl-6-methoxyphenol hydroxylase-like FAD-dependent oxidoreductase